MPVVLTFYESNEAGIVERGLSQRLEDEESWFSIDNVLECAELTSELYAEHMPPCEDDDDAVHKAVGGLAPNCAAIASECDDVHQGAMLKRLCPKTCDACGHATAVVQIASTTKQPKLLWNPEAVPSDVAESKTWLAFCAQQTTQDELLAEARRALGINDAMHSRP